MAAINITRFYGMIPRMGDDMLPEGEPVNAAQLAINTRVKSGHLRPYKTTKFETNVPVTDPATIVRINAFGATDQLWFTFPTVTDVVRAPTSDPVGSFEFSGEFFYFTRVGVVPFMTYGDLAFGREPFDPSLTYPRAAATHGNFTEPAVFALGVPKPPSSLKPKATVINYENRQTVSFARDNSNIATITTAVPHDLRSGSIVTITGFGERTITQPVIVPPFNPNPDPNQPVDTIEP